MGKILSRSRFDVFPVIQCGCQFVYFCAFSDNELGFKTFEWKFLKNITFFSSYGFNNLFIGQCF